MRVKEISIEAPRAAATTVIVSTSTAQSAVLQAGEYLFMCDQACNILVGVNPTATTSCLPVPASTLLRIVGVQEGEKIAIIAAASGTAWLYRAI